MQHCNEEEQLLYPRFWMKRGFDRKRNKLLYATLLKKRDIVKKRNKL